MTYKELLCITFTFAIYGSVFNLVNSQPAPPTFDRQNFNYFSTSVQLAWDYNSSLIYNLGIVYDGAEQPSCDSGDDDVVPENLFDKANNGSDLQALGKYDLYLCAIDGNQTSNSTKANITMGPPPPSNFSQTSATNDRLTIAWEDSCISGCGESRNTEKYVLTYKQRNEDENSRDEVNVTALANQVTLENLTANTDYDVTIIIHSVGLNVFSDKVLEIFTTVPGKPNQPNITASTTDTITIEWMEVSGDVSETYKIFLDGNEIQSAVSSPAIINNLDSNTNYRFTIAANNSAGVGQQSDPSNQYPTRYEPPPSFVVDNDSVTSDSLFLSWNKPDDGGKNNTFKNYSVVFSPDEGCADINGTTAQLSNLLSNTEYNISVFVLTIEGVNGTPAKLQTVTIPEKVSSLTFSESNTDSITFQWKSVYGHISVIYNVIVNHVNDLQTEDTNATITDLNSNSEYKVQVQAGNFGGEGEISEYEEFYTIPDKVASLEVKSTTTSSISLQWNAVSNVRNVSVNYTVAVNKNDFVTIINETQAEISDLESNTNNEFEVRAINSAGDGENSETLTIPTRPEKVNETCYINSTTNTISLNWTAVSGEADVVYQVIVNNEVKISNLTNTYGTINVSTSNEPYSVRVKALNKGGEGDSSNETTFYTIPKSISNFSVSESKEDEIFLQWVNETEGSANKTYTLKWETFGDGRTNSIQNINSTEFGVKNLTSNTEYSFIVLASNIAGLSDPSKTIVYPTIPGIPLDVNASQGRDPRKNIELRWKNPPGGNAINNYSITWIPATDPSQIIYDNKEPNFTENYEYSIDRQDLTPGENYEVTIASINDAGMQEDTINITTVPENIKDFDANQNSVNPTTAIDLSWKKTEFVGDNIVISFNNSNGEFVSKTEIFNFTSNAESTTDGLYPGTTYEFKAKVVSNGLESQNETTAKMNTKPAPPNVTEEDKSANSITLKWSLDGFADAVVVSYELKGKVESLTFNASISTKKFENLAADTVYNFTFYSKLNSNVNEVEEKSYSTSTEIKTFDKTDVGLIVGITVAVVFVVVILVVGYFVHRNRRISKKKSPHTPRRPMTPPPNTAIRPKKPSRVVKKNFQAHLDLLHADSDLRFSSEYQLFQGVGEDNSTEIASEPDNKSKNRYRNILAYDHNRVVLKASDSNTDDYINASYIPGYNREREYIATQGPLPNTKDDFWRMVWEQNTRIIVMVTQTVESGKIKCDHYWPYDDSTISVADMMLTVQQQNVESEWTVRYMELTKDSETRKIVHFHYTAWPDHGVPSKTSSLIRFIREVRQHIESGNNSDGPSVVHCSAGVGRTGTFIAMDHAMQFMKDHDSIDLFGIVREMREHRKFMVQTEIQYMFLHEMVADVIKEENSMEPLYENSIIQSKDPIYENTAYIRDSRII